MDGYCCLGGEVDEALTVHKTMTRKGILPDTHSYNILINGYCKKLKVNREIHIFRQMLLKGLILTIQAYNTILQGLFRVGRHAEARKFFTEKMLNKGPKQDIVTCSILLNGLCQNHYVVEVMSFHTMQSAGLNPDVCIYNILIDGLNKNGHPEKAISLFYNLPSKGLRPTVKTCNMMIQGFCQEGLLNEAYKLFKEMKAGECLTNDLILPTIHLSAVVFKTIKYNQAIDEMRALLALHKKFLT